jgi:hypothetical protein
MRLAIATLAIGEWEDVPEIHKPMKALAEKVGADFVKITKREHADWHIYYEKTQIQRILKDYDWVLYLDGDVLVTPMGIAESGMIHAAQNANCEISLYDERSRSDYLTRSAVEDQYAIVGKKVPDWWNGRHYNAGVMLVPKEYANVFDSPIVTSMDYQDQAWLNWKIAEDRIPVDPMDWRFNCMPFASKGVDVEEAFLVHYAGWSNYVTGVKDFRGLVRAYPFVPRQWMARRPIEMRNPLTGISGPTKTPPPGVRGTEQGGGRGGWFNASRRSRGRGARAQRSRG